MNLLLKNKRFLFLILVMPILMLSACSPSVTPSTDNPPEVETTTGKDEITSLDAGEIPEIEWFTPTEQLLTDWLIVPDPASLFRISLSQRTQVDSTIDTKKILFFYTKQHTLYDKVVGQVLAVFLEKNIPVEVSLVLAEENDAALYALSRAEANNIDLIFAMGSSSTAFLHDNYQNGAIPVVTLLSKDPVLLGQASDYESGSGTNIAYTSVGVPVELQMSYFQTLVPDLKNIVVLYAQDNVSAVKTQVEPLDAYAKAADINIIHVATETEEDLDEVIAELEKKLPVAIARINNRDPEMQESILLVTSTGSIVKVFETVNAIAGNTPVVSLFPGLVQEGAVSAVLSVGVSFDSNAILAALYGIQILQDDVAPGDLPVGVITPPDVAISFSKAREIGLKIPFAFFESAAVVYDIDGVLVRDQGQLVE